MTEVRSWAKSDPPRPLTDEIRKAWIGDPDFYDAWTAYMIANWVARHIDEQENTIDNRYGGRNHAY